MFFGEVKTELSLNGILSSSIEILSLYVDLNQRKVSEFENEKTQLMKEFIDKHKNSFNNTDLKFSSKLKKI